MRRNSRLAHSAAEPETICLHGQKGDRFSSFSFVEDRFESSHSGDTDSSLFSVRRLFSQARERKAKTAIIEQIPAQGAISDENREIRRLFPDYKNTGLVRVTFWREKFTGSDYRALSGNSLVGYAVLKKDEVSSKQFIRWHVFESIFTKDAYEHTYVRCARKFTVSVGTRRSNCKHTINGVLFCEGNALNKVCAQVAIRSLCADGESDRPYFSTLNSHARNHWKTHKDDYDDPFSPSEGFFPPQINACLKKLGYGVEAIDYERLQVQEELPYSKFLYAGLESGAGALLGFKFGDEDKHIIPVFGHTFNRDGLVPRSDAAYFRVGKSRFIPSDAWLSSFVCHDGKFGSNYCLPRYYIPPKNVCFVAALIPPNFAYSGVTAEAYGIQSVNTLVNFLREQGDTTNRWAKRLIASYSEQQVVLRAIPISVRDYIDHLRQMEDWNDGREASGTCDGLLKYLEDHCHLKHLWMIEVSLPELFPINHRKLGEILLDGTVKPKRTKAVASPFLLARLVGNFYLGELDKLGTTKSDLKSHTRVLGSTLDLRA